jgi:hypothetical protein
MGTDETAFLWHVSDAQAGAPVSGDLREVLAGKLDKTGGHGHDTHNALQRSRLASAVSPDEPD